MVHNGDVRREGLSLGIFVQLEPSRMASGWAITVAVKEIATAKGTRGTCIVAGLMRRVPARKKFSSTPNKVDVAF